MNASLQLILRAVLCAMFLLCSCTPRSRGRITTEGYRPVDAAGKASMISAIEAQNAQIRSVRARIETRLRHRAGEENPTLAAVFIYPEVLRLEFFATALNRLSALIIADAQELRAINLNKMQAFAGASSSENLQKLLAIPFVPEEFMRWLAGRAAVSSDQEQQAEIMRHDRTNHALVILPGAERKLVLLLDLAGCTDTSRLISAEARCPLLIASELTDEDGRTIIYSSYNYDLSGAENLVFPSRISFSLPQLAVSGELNMREVRVNADLSQEKERLFTLRFPAGMQAISLDDLVRDSVDPLF